VHLGKTDAHLLDRLDRDHSLTAEDGHGVDGFLFEKLLYSLFGCHVPDPFELFSLLFRQ
jgi:hypothetical protein